MDPFLDTYDLQNLNQESTKNLDRLLTSSEIKSIIKGFQSLIHWWILPIFLKRTNTSTPETVAKNWREENLLNSFYKPNITFLPKLFKEMTKKENYRPISLMNKHENFWTKYCQVKLNSIYKRSFTMIKFIFSLKWKMVQYTPINKHNSSYQQNER
jgi:hypothetical protein